MPRTTEPPVGGSPPGDRPQPLDPPMLPVVLAGTALWAIATVTVLPFRAEHPSWFWVCVAGLLWGIPGTAVMMRHDAARRRRHAEAHLDGRAEAPIDGRAEAPIDGRPER